MKSFADVIDLWPSAGELARDIEQDPVTVRSWKARKSIPSQYWSAIIYAANQRGVRGVTLDSLASMSRPRKRRAA